MDMLQRPAVIHEFGGEEIEQLRVLEDYERLKEKSKCQAECLDAFDKKLRAAEAEVERLKNNCDYLDQKLDEELAKKGKLP